MEVLVEGRLPEDNGIGGPKRDAPDVDGPVFITSQEELLSGDICECSDHGRLDEYDLVREATP